MQTMMDFTKAKSMININGRQYSNMQGNLTGADIKRMGNIKGNRQLMVQTQYGKYEKVNDNDRVNIAPNAKFKDVPKVRKADSILG